jgi:tetraacyldisaccharide 4'-kinase
VLDERVLPAGRLREPIAAARFADALLVTEVRLKPDATSDVAGKLGVNTAFAVTRTLGDPPGIGKDQQVFAVAGVARPERFFADLRGAGWRVAGTLAFRDHHRFTRDDVERIRRAAHAAGAAVVVTTAKDAIRFESTEMGGLAIGAVPLAAQIEPVERFHEWLMGRVRRAR